MSRKLNPAMAKPLLYAKRDQVGPKGEPVNSIATHPQEVDSIARRLWKVIYDGNSTNLQQQAADFIAKYTKSGAIFIGPSFEVSKITGSQVKASCTKAKKSAAGMDGWEPA